MPRKYLNSKEALEFNRKVFDTFVHLQDLEGLSNKEICEGSGISFVNTQLPRNTGITRQNYRGTKIYVGQRDMTDIVTFYDLVRAINKVNPDLEFLKVIALACGFQPDAIKKLLSSPREPYTFHYPSIETTEGGSEQG